MHEHYSLQELNMLRKDLQTVAEHIKVRTHEITQILKIKEPKWAKAEEKYFKELQEALGDKANTVNKATRIPVSDALRNEIRTSIVRSPNIHIGQYSIRMNQIHDAREELKYELSQLTREQKRITEKIRTVDSAVDRAIENGTMQKNTNRFSNQIKSALLSLKETFTPTKKCPTSMSSDTSSNGLSSDDSDDSSDESSQTNSPH